jgi:uncharacterized protein (TIGR02145 family)
MKRIIFLLAGFAFLPFVNQSQTVADYDGNIYDTVVIGPHSWLKQNLRVTHYNDGTPIPNVTDSAQWENLATGARCYYQNDSLAIDSVYGPLYNWYAANNSVNICPSGWHVSSNAEWQETEAYLGSLYIAGGKMKESGNLHWLSPNTGATNSTGYTGLPGGARLPASGYQFLHENGVWWTSTTYNPASAWGVYMYYLSPGTEHDPWPKKAGLSIRCIKDVETGLKEDDPGNSIRIYPNPATSMITVENPSVQNTDFIIYDLVGKPVLQKKLTKNKTVEDISSFPSGVYFIIINTEKGFVSQKLIKK